MIETGQAKILIVNDNAGELAALIAGLKDEGFSISGTTDAFSAFDILDRAHFDVVLIDLMIPDLNGLSFARHIRERYPRVKTMLMSDYLLSPVQLARANTGVIGFVPKPCNCKDLSIFLSKKLSPTHQADEREPSPLKPHTPVDILSIKYSC